MDLDLCQNTLEIAATKSFFQIQLCVGSTGIRATRMDEFGVSVPVPAEITEVSCSFQIIWSCSDPEENSECRLCYCDIAADQYMSLMLSIHYACPPCLIQLVYTQLLSIIVL